MPLAFRSLSHGRIAFGFFNIETDLLLLEELFFFAEDFCTGVADLARAAAQAHVAGQLRAPGGSVQVALAGWRICQPAQVGSLHGAIAGADRSGFIGATYQRYPFPADPQDFKQSPVGAERREEMVELIRPYGQEAEIELRCDVEQGQVWVGPYAFSNQGFGELCAYVERGGYPRYRAERRPPYVTAMGTALRELDSPWVEEIR